jgi:GT2 family glycosyltransferase
MNPKPLLESEMMPSKLPLVCAYVITYNGKRFLERCFRTLKQRTDYENCRLILVDNGSSDGSGEYVREHFPEVEIVRVFPNAGYAHGANSAIEDARRRGADYIVLMNDDIAILHPQWLREAIVHAESDPNIGIIGFVDTANENEQDAAPNATLSEVDYINGFAMVIPLALFDRIGLFDEVYYVSGDEDDLVARAQAAGYRSVKLGVPIYHFGSGTFLTLGRGATYLQMRNGIRFCLKYRSPVRALMRAARLLDIACNPWPLTLNDRQVGYCAMRNAGNGAGNLLLWLRAVAWNIVRLPQTYRIRAAERRLIRQAIVSRSQP